MAKKQKKIFRYYCVVKKCPYDFGMGPGVVGRTEVSFTDERGLGWKSALFERSKLEAAEKLLQDCCTVLVEDKVKGKPWDPNPQKITKKECKKRSKTP